MAAGGTFLCKISALQILRRTVLAIHPLGPRYLLHNPGLTLLKYVFVKPGC